MTEEVILNVRTCLDGIRMMFYQLFLKVGLEKSGKEEKGNKKDSRHLSSESFFLVNGSEYAHRGAPRGEVVRADRGGKLELLEVEE